MKTSVFYALLFSVTLVTTCLSTTEKKKEKRQFFLALEGISALLGTLLGGTAAVTGGVAAGDLINEAINTHGSHSHSHSHTYTDTDTVTAAPVAVQTLSKGIPRVSVIIDALLRTK